MNLFIRIDGTLFDGTYRIYIRNSKNSLERQALSKNGELINRNKVSLDNMPKQYVSKSLREAIGTLKKYYVVSVNREDRNFTYIKEAVLNFKGQRK